MISNTDVLGKHAVLGRRLLDQLLSLQTKEHAVAPAWTPCAPIGLGLVKLFAKGVAVTVRECRWLRKIDYLGGNVMGSSHNCSN